MSSNLTPSARRNASLIAILGIAALAMASRLYRLEAPNLWLDEAISLWAARLPWRELLPTLAAYDESPPLYFALLHVWRLAGEDEVWLRLPSVVFSAASVVLGGLLARRVAGAGAGVLAAGLLCLSPGQVAHAQDARMYALVGLLALGTTYCALRAIEGTRAVWALAWGASAALLGATNYPALLVAASLMLGGMAIAALDHSRPKARVILLAAGSSLLLWLPVAPVFFSQARLVAANYWIPRLSESKVRETMFQATAGVLPPTQHVQLGEPIEIQGPLDLIKMVISIPRAEPFRQVSLQLILHQQALALVLVAAVLYGVWVLQRRSGMAAAVLPFAAVVLPVGTLLAISTVRPLLLARTLAGSAPVAYVLTAAACSALPRAVGAPLIALVLLWQALALGQHWWYPQGERWRETAAQLARQSNANDLVVVSGRWAQLPLDYYLAQEASPALQKVGVPVELKDRGKPEPVMTEADARRLLARVAERQRVWLVQSHDDVNDPNRDVRRLLEAEFSCFEVWPRQGVSLLLFARCTA